MAKKETQKIPQGAFQFQDHGCQATVKFANEGDEEPKMDMLAYSGGVIEDHWWWGNLVIDLNGMKFSKNKYPILENHSAERKVAFMKGKPLIENNQLKLNSDKVSFVDTPYADEFIKLSKKGFPYESSIYAVPSSIERLEKGATAEVNGFKFKGPGTVWRQCEFKEASVCVFGWDTNSRASAFASPEMEVDLEVLDLKFMEENVNSIKEVKTEMDINQFKKDHEDVYAEVVEEVTTSVTSALEIKFSAEKKTLEDSHSEVITTLNTQMSNKEERVLELEKKDDLRTERELRQTGDNLWTSKLSESSIPEHLHEKVQKHVAYSKFVNDGVLDAEKFKEAIDAEIKDWEDKGVTSSIMGSGFTKKDPDDKVIESEEKSKSATKMANNLLEIAGQPQEEK